MFVAAVPVSCRSAVQVVLCVEGMTSVSACAKVPLLLMCVGSRVSCNMSHASCADRGVRTALVVAHSSV